MDTFIPSVFADFNLWSHFVGQNTSISGYISSGPEIASIKIFCSSDSWTYTYPTLQQAVDHARILRLLQYANKPYLLGKDMRYDLTLPADYSCETLGAADFRYHFDHERG